MTALYIGLMSGTSLDGVDAVLAEFGGAAPLRVLAHAHRPFDAGLAAELLALNSPGNDELQRGALAANALVHMYALAVRDLLGGAALDAADVRAIGAHGQTVRHRPGGAGGGDTGYTIQLNNAALLAELCGIDVVADFRARDIAAGGQGAPLVPAFHRALFGQAGVARAVLNLGGIANLTVLAADGATLGFDCGPANALLDGWCLRHTGRPYDDNGAWAAGGSVRPALLQALQREPFFNAAPPKSTGRDLFNAAWLDAHVATLPGAASFAPRDVQCTLAALTAWCCAEAVRKHAGAASELLVCGGGALNGHLMGSIAALLPTVAVRPSDAAGLPCQQVEAAAFAWLAARFIAREPGNLVSVTGARGPRVLGALYPAG